MKVTTTSVDRQESCRGGLARLARFALLVHEGGEGGAHGDLLLERAVGTDPEERALAAFAAPELARALELPAASGAALLLRELPDHRRHYLFYEGEISGDRGRVTRLDAGVYLARPAAEDAEEADAGWELTFHGRQIAGRLLLRPAGDAPGGWRLSRRA